MVRSVLDSLADALRRPDSAVAMLAGKVLVLGSGGLIGAELVKVQSIDHGIIYSVDWLFPVASQPEHRNIGSEEPTSHRSPPSWSVGQI